jgi:hypothetical protein
MIRPVPQVLSAGEFSMINVHIQECGALIVQVAGTIDARTRSECQPYAISRPRLQDEFRTGLRCGCEGGSLRRDLIPARRQIQKLKSPCSLESAVAQVPLPSKSYYVPVFFGSMLIDLARGLRRYR